MDFTKPPETPYVNVLLYGPPGTGKSAAAGSAPPGVLYLNLDLPNATHFVHSQHPDGSIMEVRFEGMKTLGEVALEVGVPQDVIQTVVVDPVAELHRRLLEEASNRAIRPRIDTYGDVSVHIERFCRHLCGCPVNVVIVCHEQPIEDEGAGEIEHLPYTGTKNPALGQKLLGMVDVVGYTGRVEVKDGAPQYVAQLIPALGRRGKDRFDVLGTVRALDLSEWVKVITEAQRAPTNKVEVAA